MRFSSSSVTAPDAAAAAATDMIFAIPIITRAATSLAVRVLPFISVKITASISTLLLISYSSVAATA